MPLPIDLSNWQPKADLITENLPKALGKASLRDFHWTFTELMSGDPTEGRKLRDGVSCPVRPCESIPRCRLLQVSVPSRRSNPCYLLRSALCKIMQVGAGCSLRPFRSDRSRAAARLPKQRQRDFWFCCKQFLNLTWRPPEIVLGASRGDPVHPHSNALKSKESVSEAGHIVTSRTFRDSRKLTTQA